MSTPKLDPRAARTDLTSRECAKFIGVVVNILKMQGHEPEEIRYVMRVLAFSTEHMDGRDFDKIAASCLGGAIGGLTEMAPPESIQTAVEWWAECDAAWGMVESGGPKGVN